MLGRAILLIEGVIKQLCPELDLFKLLSDKMIERSKKSFDIKKNILDISNLQREKINSKGMIDYADACVELSLLAAEEAQLAILEAISATAEYEEKFEK